VNSSKTEKEPRWLKTPIANLVCNATSGVYYARVRVRGKLIWKTLKTDRMSVAKLRLGDFLKEENHRAEATQATIRGKMTFGDALVSYRQQLADAQHLKPSAKLYREKCIKALLKSWPGLEDTDVRKISVSDCRGWASRFARDYSPTVFNNTVGTLRHIIGIAIRAGARYGNPADEIKKLKVRQKILRLPEHDQFPLLVEKVRTAGGGFSRGCGDLFEFLAYSGARKSEAARVLGSDCDFINGRITIKGDPDTGTKNWEIRTIPMIPDMRRLARVNWRRIQSLTCANAKKRSTRLVRNWKSPALHTTICGTYLQHGASNREWTFPQCLAGLAIRTAERWP
jgi:integrase